LVETDHVIKFSIDEENKMEDYGCNVAQAIGDGRIILTRWQYQSLNFFKVSGS
jgi:hypothetical protein